MKDYIRLIEEGKATLPTDKLMVFEHAKRIASIYKCALPLAQFITYILLNDDGYYDRAEWVENKSFMMQYMDEVFPSIPDYCSYYHPAYSTLRLTDGISNLLEINKSADRCDMHINSYTSFWNDYEDYPSLKMATKVLYYMNILASQNYIFTNQIRVSEIRKHVEIYRESIRKADRAFKRNDDSVIGCQYAFNPDKIMIGKRFTDFTVLLLHDNTTSVMFEESGFFYGNADSAYDYKYDMDSTGVNNVDKLKFCANCMATCNNMTRILDNFESLLERLRNEYSEYSNKQKTIK